MLPKSDLRKILCPSTAYESSPKIPSVDTSNRGEIAYHVTGIQNTGQPFRKAIPHVM